MLTQRVQRRQAENAALAALSQLQQIEADRKKADGRKKVLDIVERETTGERVLREEIRQADERDV